MEEETGKTKKISNIKVYLAISLFLVSIGLVYQGYEMISEYLSYPILTTSPIANPFDFPDVYICHKTHFIKRKLTPGYFNYDNQRYIENSTILLYDAVFKVNFPEFWSILLFNESHSSSLVNNHSDIVSNAILRSLTSYQIGRSSQPTPEDLIIYCFFKQKLCNFSDFIVVSSGLGNNHCLRFRTNSNILDISGMKYGLRVFLFFENYLDAIVDIPSNHLFPIINYYIVSRGSWPNFNKPTDFTYQGLNTRNSLKYQILKRVETPKQKCKIKTNRKMCFKSRLQNQVICEDFVDDAEICKNIFYQSKLIEKCNCTSNEWLLQPNQITVKDCMSFDSRNVEHKGFSFENNTWFYLNLSDVKINFNQLFNINQTKTDFFCLNEFLGSQPSLAVANCLDNCEKEYYQIDQRQIIVDYGEIFRFIPIIINYVNSYLTFLNNQTSGGYFNYTLVNLLKEYNVWDSFIKINIGAPSSSLDIFSEQLNGTQSEEYWKYPLSVLFANIGGALGLWIGACVVTIFEVIESMVLSCRKKKNKTPTNKIKDNPQNEFQIIE